MASRILLRAALWVGRVRRYIFQSILFGDVVLLPVFVHPLFTVIIQQIEEEILGVLFVIYDLLITFMVVFMSNVNVY
jgi:hypothetical protein